MIADNGRNIVAVVTILILPALASFSLRCYVRLTRKCWGTDDIFAGISIPFFVALCSACLACAIHGIGSKDAHITGGMAERTSALLSFFIFQLVWAGTTIFVKLSIAAQQMRVAETTQPGIVWLLRVVMATYCTAVVAALVYVIAQCHPLAYTWNKTIPGGQCHNPLIVQRISTGVLALNIATDWMCALLPIPLLWNVQISTNAKAAAAALLGLGVFASVCAIVRLKLVSGLTATDDYFFHLGPIVVWAFTEAGVGMIAANVSTLRPLFRILANGSSAMRRTGDGPSWGSRGGMGRMSRAGAIELGDSKNGYGETVVEVGSHNSIADDSSGVDMLGKRAFESDTTLSLKDLPPK
ncbi:hypothetical protein SLS56_008701 [Neofusicoccum ribis]|uniref:Rhodopsin domain-containing protein n=1 Tax=Neofusicoccum ribis TaxID=45134 RepID=A0ABR3SJD9_9PEZI